MRAKTPADLNNMRAGGQLLAGILRDLAGKVAPGITPKELSADCAEQIKKNNMQAVVLGYDGFPDVICISVNNAIVHGIPQPDPIKDGDVVKLDLTLGYKGMINDSAVTVIAGKSSDKDAQRLVRGTKEALDAGIAAIKGDGTRVGDISSAVQNVLEKKYHLGVIRELVGHGVGYEIHEAPNIPNYGVAGTGPVLHAGMTIAVEPMAALGDWHISFAKDKNTILMKDGSLGAHFEHTILITQDGAEILTLP
ncbi:MAG TPA: type I methionyl aminopeptidase [Candidatus Saccharimonadales bacterium]|nr:type I methionyl aminopeptidase [Candidatus Saccharimonadales bacterium]